MRNWITQIFKRTHQAGGSENVERVRQCMKSVGHRFRRKELLIQALKHRSFLPQVHEQRVSSNERLELLGDAVLGLIVTEDLHRHFPEKEEGEITAIKSLLVSRKILSRVARSFNLGEFILMSESEDRSGGRVRPSIIADAFEAIVGAIYLDGGLKKARAFVRRTLLCEMDQILSEEQHRNFKSMLLELAQGRNLGTPHYIVLSEDGPDHNKLFTVEVRIQNHPMGIGSGNSKKRAEQRAAQNALAQLQ